MGTRYKVLIESRKTLSFVFVGSDDIKDAVFKAALDIKSHTDNPDEWKVVGIMKGDYAE